MIAAGKGAKAIAPLIAVALCLAADAAPAIEPVFSTTFGGAIRGCDPVAYFTEGRPVEGRMGAASPAIPAGGV